MKKTKLTRSLMAACSIVALSAVMYGCVHSGDDAPPAMEDPPAPTPVAVDLDGSTDLMAGTTTIPAGTSRTVGDTTITCTGTEDCVLTVMQDDVTGAYSATSTGGTVTVAVAPPPAPPTTYTVDLMGSEDLTAGTTTIQAGDSVTVGRTTVECPAGGDACVLTVAVDSVTGNMVASATGAQPTVTVAPPPAPPMTYTVDLMGSEDLSAGTTTIQAGDSVTVGRTTVECPAGGDACVLTVAVDSVTGNMVASATGAQPTVTVADPPAPPMEYMVTLPDGHGLSDGVTTIDPGQTVTVNGTEITCPGPDACVLTVKTDDVTRAQTATSTGGEVMVTTAATRMAAEQERIRQEHEGHRETLRLAEEELARVQALFDAGDATANELAAAQMAVDEAKKLAGNQPPPPPDPVVVAADGSVTHAELQTAFMDILPNPGDSDSFTIAAGGTEVRGGITFSCNSVRPCTVTIENNVGTIVASWTSHSVDGSAAIVVASHPNDDLLNDPLHPTLTLNSSNAASVADIIEEAIESTGTAPTPDGARGNASTAIGGMGLDGFGVANTNMFTLTSDLDPNSDDYAAGPPATGGAMLRFTDVPNDETMKSNLRTLHAGRTALEGWTSSVLFADWGDTHGTGDGGFETAALVYDDHEEPTTEPFDDDLAAKVAHRSAWFTLANGAVAIDSAADNAADQLARTELTVEGGQISTLTTTVPDASTHTGTYFGASGTYACTTGCSIERGTAGTTPFNISAGTWTFTPDADQTVTIPDQDYLVFGAWLTVPDAADTGEHRIGVFYNGMREYGTVDVALTGMATYKGGAAGVYRDRDASGMFTARAELTADFGADNAAGMLSGRIDNFKNSNGVYLGMDNADTPNDPVTGGENDWVVTLNGAADNISSGTVAGTSVSGSADGVSWSAGQWNAQLYGRSTDADGDPVMPSGVAGEFRAFSGAVAADDPDPAMPPTRAVVGAFGATMQDDE